MKCEHCGYEWEPRKPEPVSCPRCKRRFDYPKDAIDDDPLREARTKERGFERTVYVLSLLTPELEEKDIGCVIVGGSAVEFYTRNWYATGDIDLAIDRAKRAEVLKVFKDFGFKSEGRMWVREDLGLYLEIPGDIGDIDTNRVTKVNTDAGHAYIIGLEDIILDRLNAAKHWDSASDREQAIRIIALYHDEMDWSYLKRKAKQDKVDDVLDQVKGAAKDARSSLE
ncbi:MAG: hypothetical protein AYK23_04320 [Candidatus Proteinoplasmatales archaeon SG8-5]|nr:MAG: hypothetical protein AYK23_04320 [Candidatus Proteinoplasmatales archaeon SG8-5]